MYPAVRDAKAAIRYLRSRATDLGVDGALVHARGGGALLQVARHVEDGLARLLLEAVEGAVAGALHLEHPQLEALRGGGEGVERGVLSV